tara:strand:+ start:43 stop:222 length:180 start_codon:yes stop_codon:yes gene_type:complete
MNSIYNIRNNQEFILSTENVQQKINSLLIELQEKTGVSDEELDELKEILDLADFPLIQD